MSQLITLSLPLNVVATCEELTRLRYADYLLQAWPADATTTIVILRVPDDTAPRVRAALGWPHPANPDPYRLDIDQRWVPPRHR